MILNAGDHRELCREMGPTHLPDACKYILEYNVTCEGVDWIHLSQDRDQWLTFVNTVMDLGFHKILEMSSQGEEILASRKKILKLEERSLIFGKELSEMTLVIGSRNF
jgi:hypothetical protein